MSLSELERKEEVSRSYPEAKTKLINEIVDLYKSYEVIGIAPLTGISSNVIQGIRASLRGKAQIKVAKNKLKQKALDKVIKEKGSLKSLRPYLKGSCALIFTEMNPFSLQRFFNRNRVPSSAKVGMISSKDVNVSAGATNMDPGPVISVLNAAGLKTQVVNRKIHIAQDVVILKEGDIVTASIAEVLNRLGMKPFLTGLHLDVALFEGNIIKEKELFIDDEKIMSDLVQSFQNALNLALKINYITRDTVIPLLQKASSNVQSLALETKDNASLMLNKAVSHATGLKRLTNSEDDKESE